MKETTEKNKRSGKRRFDWSIIGNLDRKNVFLSYPIITEAKSYWPGSENLPTSLEVVTTRYSVSGIYNPETRTIKIGVSRISRLDYDCRIDGREHAIKRALNSFVHITVPTDVNPGKFFKEVCSGFCHVKFVDMQKANQLTNINTENADLTNQQPVEAVPIVEEFSESQVH